MCDPSIEMERDAATQHDHCKCGERIIRRADKRIPLWMQSKLCEECERDEE